MNENLTVQPMEQQPPTPTPEEAGGAGRMFTQDKVNRIVADRLAREREKLADGSGYKAQYEAVKQELESMKAAQLHQAKENAYRALLADAGIHEKRMNTVMRASKAEIDALELDEAGKIVGADDLTKAVQKEWADFVVTTTIIGGRCA